MFEDIVRQHGAMIGRIAFTYESTPELAEDLVQEIHVAIWRALPSFRGGATPACRIVIAACVLAVVFGLTGVAIRIRYGTAPKLSPVVDVLILALVIPSTWLYGRRIHHDRSRLECLRRTLGRNA